MTYRQDITNIEIINKLTNHLHWLSEQDTITVIPYIGAWGMILSIPIILIIDIFFVRRNVKEESKFLYHNGMNYTQAKYILNHNGFRFFKIRMILVYFFGLCLITIVLFAKNSSN